MPFSARFMQILFILPATSLECDDVVDQAREQRRRLSSFIMTIFINSFNFHTTTFFYTMTLQQRMGK